MELLSDSRIDPSKNYYDIIKYAYEKKHKDLAKIILADPRIDPSERNYPEIVKLILQHSEIDINTTHSCLLIACAFPYIDIVRVLLDDKRINPTTYGNTVIQIAYIKNNREIIELLLADPRVENPSDDFIEVLRAQNRDL